MVGIAHSHFVDGPGTDSPHIRDLRVKAFDIATLAIDGAEALVCVECRVVALGDGSRNPVVSGNVIIQTSKGLLEWIGTRYVVEVVVLGLSVDRSSGGIWSGIISLYGLGDSIEPARRNDIASKGSPLYHSPNNCCRCWVIDSGLSGEVAVPHRQRWDRDGARRGSAMLQDLVEVEVKKRLIPEDGAPDGTAKVVITKHRHGLLPRPVREGIGRCV